MLTPSSALRELADSAGRLGGQAAGLLKDRLELLALELREDKIRLTQALILALAGVGLLGLGLVLLGCAAVLALPPEWRVPALAVLGVVALIVGALALVGVRRRLSARAGLLAQSIAELKKDAECF